MPLAAGFGLFLRELSHFLFQVPYLPLHSFVLLLLSVFCSYAFISLLCHLLKVLFQAADQALRMWSGGQMRSPPQFYYLLSIYMKIQSTNNGPKTQYKGTDLQRYQQRRYRSPIYWQQLKQSTAFEIVL